MKQVHPIREIRELTTHLIDADPASLHHGVASHEEDRALRESIRRFGVMSALIVSEDGAGRYLVIDGLRRLQTARELGLRKLWCVVHPPMNSGERESLRYHLETTFRPLTKAELTKERRRLRNLGVDPDEAPIYTSTE